MVEIELKEGCYGRGKRINKGEKMWVMGIESSIFFSLFVVMVYEEEKWCEIYLLECVEIRLKRI